MNAIAATAPDLCSEEGAQRLARSILAYWRKRSIDSVKLRIELNGRVYAVRGNLTAAGLPPGEAGPRFGAPDRELADRRRRRDERESECAAPWWLSSLRSSLARLN